MQALVFNGINQPLDYQTVSKPISSKGQVEVQLSAAALNHRDVWITKGQYAGIKFPTILGSDGAGIYNGQEVIINPSLDWGSNPAYPGSNYRILGLPDNGTFAEAVAVSRRNLLPKPAHLTIEQAAALPLAGLTAWRALFSRCGLKKGEKVLISGVGGGVALFALQFAVAAGAEVWVTSGSDEKIKKAVSMGAKGGANYKNADWDKTLKAEASGFDVVIDSAAGDQLARLVGLGHPGARIGIYGGTLGKINNLSPQVIFWKQISVHGTSMGNDQEFKKMVQFVAKHEIVPVIDAIFALEQGNDAIALMDSGVQFGKIVLKIN